MMTEPRAPLDVSTSSRRRPCAAEGDEDESVDEQQLYGEDNWEVIDELDDRDSDGGTTESEEDIRTVTVASVPPRAQSAVPTAQTPRLEYTPAASTQRRVIARPGETRSFTSRSGRLTGR